MEDDVGGAMMAAKKKNIHAKPLACRWEFASPEIISGVPAQLRKDTLRMLTPDEVREEIEEVFKKLPPCVQVVFASKKCLACGQVLSYLQKSSIHTFVSRKEIRG